MTPDELLNDLRDIQLPEASHPISGTELSIVPFVALAFVLLIVLVSRFFRARNWLREARQRLREINRDNPRDAQALLDLAKKIAPYRQVSPLPRAAFLPSHSIGAREVRLLYDHLQNIIEK